MRVAIGNRGVLCLGVLMFATVLGLVIGLSNSPIAGVAVTGVLGLGAAIAGVWSNKKKQGESGADDPPRLSSNLAGTLLVAASIGLLLGGYLGIRAKLDHDPRLSQATRTFPWTGSSSPKTADQAIDWLIVQDHLLARGFTREQVASLYQIEVTPPPKVEQPGLQFEPTRKALSPMFAEQSKPAASPFGTLIAKQPPPDEIGFPHLPSIFNPPASSRS
jgi:hypothetical protein